MAIYVDYTGRLTPAQLKAAGISGVCRYLSWLPNSKCILKPEYDMLVSGGIDVVLNWEYAAQDWLGGASAGAIHANEAVRQARAIGYPLGKPIPGSCDFNITRGQWNAVGKSYAETYSAGILAGGYLPGVYGPWDVLQWCHDEIPAFGFFWQAGMSWAWSNNNQDWPGANLIQRRHMTVSGLDTDVNDKMKGWDVMSSWSGRGYEPAPPNFPYNGEVASVDVATVLRTGDMTAWNKTDGAGWFITKILREIRDMVKKPVLVDLTPDDLQAIIDGVSAKVANDLADAVFTRFKDQMDK